MSHVQDKLCMNTVSIGQGSFQDKIEILGKHGVNYVSLWYDDVKDLSAQEVTDLLKTHGVEPVCLSYMGPFNQSSTEEERAARKEDEAKAECAATLGIDTVLALTGAQNALTEEQARELLHRSLATVSDICRDYGIRVAFEPIHYMYQDEWTYVCSFEEGYEVVTDVNRTNLGLMLDTCHVWMEPAITQKIEDYGHLLFGVQLCDWRPITRTKYDRVLPGDGCIPLREFVEAAKRAGWNGWYDLEIFSNELWELPAEEFVSRSIESYDRLFGAHE